MFNVLDLFCGCGGMTKGLIDAGFNVIAGIDIWDKAIDTYKANFDHDAICEDLRQLSPETFQEKYNKDKKTIDIIVGGPPCQGFSIAGKRDKNDPRNSLFMEFLKYIDYFKPKAFIMENVIGLISMKMSDGNKAIDIILNGFEDEYDTIVCKLYASDFCVPQNRRRVIILGIRRDLDVPAEEPETILDKDERIPVKTVLQPKDEIEQKYFLSERAIAGINRRRTEARNAGKGFGAQFLDLEKPSYTIPARYWKDGYDALVKYSETEIRRLTLLELKRIQTFPDDYEFVGTQREKIIQIGNAVPCTFAKYLGDHLVELLA